MSVFLTNCLSVHRGGGANFFPPGISHATPLYSVFSPYLVTGPPPPPPGSRTGYQWDIHQSNFHQGGAGLCRLLNDIYSTYFTVVYCWKLINDFIYKWYVIWIIFEIHIRNLSVKIWGNCSVCIVYILDFAHPQFAFLKILANQTTVRLPWLVQNSNACPEIAPWYRSNFSRKSRWHIIVYEKSLGLMNGPLTLSLHH